MNAPHQPNSRSQVIGSFRFKFQFDHPFEIRRAVALFISGFVLAVFAGGNVVIGRGQAQTQATPAASPTPAQPAAPGQKPAANANASPPVTGTIRGRLVADDGQPLTNANVMVQSLTASPAVKPTRVDSEGRFAFEDLPPAAYLVVATAPGYIDRSMSLGDPAQWPRHLIGSNVRITMIRGGVITGVVTNAKGEPITGVPVRAMPSGVNSSSITTFFSGGGLAESDDRGVYRIYGLLPGQYVVQAGGKGSFGQFTVSGFDIDVPTYYPSATRDTAVPVSVRGGDETTGIDIKYRGTEGHTISGFVLGNIEASAVTGAVTIFLSHAGTTSVLSLEIAAVADPRRPFSFNGVADGEYDVFAGYFTGAAENGLVATKRVIVRGGDVTGIELRLASLASITGTVTLDPIKPEDKCDKRGSQLIETILNVPRDETKKAGSQSMVSMIGGGLGALNDKGEFSLRNLEAARYRLEVKLPTESWYVRAITLPGAPAPQPPQSQTQAVAPKATAKTWPGLVTMKAGQQLSGASIMIGQDAAGLRGSLARPGETSAIPAGSRVHLVPVEGDQANNLLRYSETLVNSDGTFAFTNVAPGRYFILARVEPATEPDTPARPSAWDPVTRAKLRREAESANTIVDLKPCQRVIDYALKSGG